jgi:hypothetical protein
MKWGGLQIEMTKKTGFNFVIESGRYISHRKLNKGYSRP